MASTIKDIAAGVHEFFSSKVPGAGGDAPGDMLLVFDALGVPLSPEEFGASAPAGQQEVFASQRAAQLADQLPAANVLAGGSYIPRSGSRLSRWYETALRSSASASSEGDALSGFERRKSQALRSFDQNRILDVSAPGSGTGAGGARDAHYATSMSPRGWFLPDAKVWSEFAQSEQAPAPSGGEEGPPVESPIPVPEFEMALPPEQPDPVVERWLTTAEELSVLPELVVPVDPEGDPKPIHPRVVEQPDFVPGTIPDELIHETIEPGVLDDIAPGRGDEETTTLEERFVPTPDFLVPDLMFVDHGAVVDATDHLPVRTEGFSVSFEFCIVTFDRPWWDDVFLATPGWRIPEFSPGQLATGRASKTAGQAITLVTAGMVVIRNLFITAAWQENDLTAAEAAMSLGPFCIAGGEFVDGALSRPGLQVIAWVCQVPPRIPPS